MPRRLGAGGGPVLSLATINDMNASHSLSPIVGVCLGAVLLFVALGVTSWRRRLVSGAQPFAFVCLFLALWTFGELMELAAATAPAQQVWFHFRAVWQLPAITAGVFFTLQFAGLGRHLTRRVALLLCLPPLLAAVLILTNDAHLLFWSDGVYPAAAPAQLGSVGRLFLAYSYLLTLLNVPLLLWLFFRSPPDRWAIAIILAGNVAVRAALIADSTGRNPFAPLDAAVVGLMVLAVTYGLALFRFRIFDPVRLARQVAIEQMGEGMVVLDTAGCVADVNPTAATMLDIDTATARGQPAARFLPADLALLSTGAAERTFVLGDDAQQRYYVAQAWPLRDRHHGPLGRLLLLRDVTEQKRAEQRLLAQQRVLATLLERERLANELHDGVGQMLAFVSMQAQATRKQMADGCLGAADAQLARLAEAAQEAHLDLRQSILSLKTGPNAERSFIEALRHTLAGYRDLYAIRAELSVADGLEDAFAPECGVQLMRVVQEALSNAHRHGRARAVSVALTRHNGRARLTISDDGRGFDTAASPDDGHFGLAIMRERATQVGGSLSIDSHPGVGTRIVVDVPFAPLPEAHP